jgi:hypothetical protein
MIELNDEELLLRLRVFHRRAAARLEDFERTVSVPLEFISISFDHERDRLMLWIEPSAPR